MYQALGGIHVAWTQEMSETWLRYAAMNAELLTEPIDIVVVHDPQPLAIRSFVPDDRRTKWIMDCHLDVSSAQEDVWMLLRSHAERYDRAIFPSPGFVRPDISVPIDIVEPAIDPNSARNMPVPPEVVLTTLEHYGIDPDRPFVCQISPCDTESDLCGAVDAWDIARQTHPGLQLVMVLITTPHDSQSRGCYEDLARRTRDEPDAFVVAARETGNVELNVFQRAAAVVMQKGLRKGFGLWVSDALWKERPCVVAPAGGLTEQVIDGATGLVARTTEEFGQAISRLLSDPKLAAELGEQGRRHVKERFLITRYLRDYLKILNELHRTR
jgi:trehalose synthase